MKMKEFGQGASLASPLGSANAMSFITHVNSIGKAGTEQLSKKLGRGNSILLVVNDFGLPTESAEYSRSEASNIPLLS